MLKVKDISLMIKVIIVLSALYIFFYAVSGRAQVGLPQGRYFLDSFQVNDTTVVTAEKANWMLELYIPDNQNFTMTEYKDNEKKVTTEGMYHLNGNIVMMDKFLKMENAEIYKAFCTWKINDDLFTISVDSVQMNVVTYSLLDFMNLKQAMPFFSDLYFTKQE